MVDQRDESGAKAQEATETKEPDDSAEAKADAGEKAGEAETPEPETPEPETPESQLGRDASPALRSMGERLGRWGPRVGELVADVSGRPTIPETLQEPLARARMLRIEGDLVCAHVPSAHVPSATFARTGGHAKSVLSPFRRVLTTLQAVCLAALCMPACEMVKREAVCAAHGSTADALRRDVDAANERDAPPEAAQRAAATIRASAKTLDPAAGVPAVDDYKQAMLRLADEYERLAGENDEAEAEAEAIGMADAMEFREKAVAFYTWCRG